MAPQGTNPREKCLKCFIPALLKGLEDTMTLLNNCKRGQKRLWHQLSVMSYQHNSAPCLGCGSLANKVTVAREEASNLKMLI